MKNNTNYIITGGLGFIGSNLSIFLSKQNHKVIIIDNYSNINLILYQKLKSIKNIKIVKKNIYSCSIKFLKKISNKNSVIIHLAAISRVKDENIVYINQIYKNNIFIVNFIKMISLLEIKKFIFASSSAVYGTGKKINNENDICNPVNLYGISKLFGEKIVEQYCKNRINYNIVRIFNVYGNCKYLNKSNNLLFQNLIENKKFYIDGKGSQKRDFIYIDDLVNALYLLSLKNNLKNKLFNIGTGKNISIINFVKLVRKDFYFRNQRKFDSSLTKAHIKRLEEINWYPKFSLVPTLKLLINES